MAQHSDQTDAFGDDLGLFGRPLFEDPSARALSRVGVVDVGSNSVRMVVFDGAARSPAYFYNEKIMAGLGQGLAETGPLNPRGKERALQARRSAHPHAALRSSIGRATAATACSNGVAKPGPSSASSRGSTSCIGLFHR